MSTVPSLAKSFCLDYVKPAVALTSVDQPAYLGRVSGGPVSRRDEKLPLVAAGSCEPGQALTGAALSI